MWCRDDLAQRVILSFVALSKPFKLIYNAKRKDATLKIGQVERIRVKFHKMA